jgi:hypothetical protein
LFALFSVLALAACGGGPDLPGVAAGAPATIDAPSTDEVRIGALGSRELGSGQCGLFLWSRAESPELVFFANPESGVAAIVLDGRERALQRLAVEAPVAGGRAGSQTFATETGEVSVRLTVLETEVVEGGYRVGSASLRIADDRGWSAVVPTAGLAACQP